MISINQNLCDRCGLCVTACPFGAIDKDEKFNINVACKGCNLCMTVCKCGAIGKDAALPQTLNKAEYKDILIYAEHVDGKISPVTFELIGKARELAKCVNQQVKCLYIGSELDKKSADDLLDYGTHTIFAYLHADLEHYRSDTYTNVFADCVKQSNPTAVLVGGTSIGRSLAPRVATRCQTGLTADCTGLTMRKNTDLVQTRPAFGGNVMAQIVTTKHRPQFATVRPNVLDLPQKVKPFGTVLNMPVNSTMLQSGINLSNVRKKPVVKSIEQASCLIVAGNAFKNVREMDMLYDLAELLGGRVAASRPVIEAGLADHTMQIGLSGRTVRPKLIITCGISGAVQFVAGMKASEHIFAINTNAEAPIMKIANYAAVGDVFEVVPSLIERIKGNVQSKIGNDKSRTAN